MLDRKNEIWYNKFTFKGNNFFPPKNKKIKKFFQKSSKKCLTNLQRYSIIRVRKTKGTKNKVKIKIKNFSKK